MGLSESGWAQLLLSDMGAPTTGNNIDDIERWMTAEEPTDDWFDRDNPLNSAYLTGGPGDGTGSYASLQLAAAADAANIQEAGTPTPSSGDAGVDTGNKYTAIYNALMGNASTSVFAAAVEASPWASSHYATDPIAAIPVPAGAPAASTPSTSSSSSGSSSVIAQLLDYAQGWVNEGVPYKWGGVTQFGADCSGYIQSLFQEAGYTTPRTSQDDATAGTAVALSGPGGLKNAQPGDVLVFDYSAPADHVALYAGGNQNYVEAHTGTDAALNPVDTSALTGIRRFITTSGATEPGIGTTTNTAVAGPNGDVTGTGTDYSSDTSGSGDATLTSVDLWGLAQQGAGGFAGFGASGASTVLHDLGGFEGAASDLADTPKEIHSIFETLVTDTPQFVIRALEVGAGAAAMLTAFVLLGICLGSKDGGTVKGTAAKGLKLGAMVAAPEAAPELEGATTAGAGGGDPWAAANVKGTPLSAGPAAWARNRPGGDSRLLTGKDSSSPKQYKWTPTEQREYAAQFSARQNQRSTAPAAPTSAERAAAPTAGAVPKLRPIPRPTPNSPAHAEVRTALAGLGFGKDEIHHSMAGLPAHGSSSELLKSALKNRGAGN